MEISLDTTDRPEVSFEQRTSTLLAKLVRKLRWIGMEEEARRINLVLCQIDVVETLLADPTVRPVRLNSEARQSSPLNTRW